MQLIGLGLTTVLTTLSYAQQTNNNGGMLRTVRKGAKDLSESEMDALTTR